MGYVGWVRPLLPCLLILASCASGPLDLGPAATVVYLGTDTDVASLIPLRAGVVLSVLLDVRSDRVGAEAAVGGAAMLASNGGAPQLLLPVEAGLYASPPLGLLELAPTDAGVSVLVQDRGATYGLSGPLPEVLKLDLPLDDVPADTDLVVPLPQSWSDDYDYMLAQLLDIDGSARWSNHPDTLLAWLEFLGEPPQPTELVVPGDALPAGSAGALGVTFLRQMDPVVTFAGPVNAPFSALVAGTAWLLPVGVAP